MIRLSRLTDYGIVLMSYFAQGEPGAAFTARELSEKSKIPLPTVSKVLKSLSRSELVFSQRGVKGGYTMARAADEISVAEMIDALEGPIAMTECSSIGEGSCEFETLCPAKSPWQRINQVVRKALSGLSLADMANTQKKLGVF
jgi:FeS assembly SUF system regulator